MQTSIQISYYNKIGECYLLDFNTKILIEN